MKITLISIFILLVTSSYSISQQQQDLWTTFTVSDGLASNFVVTIIESSDGALWFGTDAGVSRFEGDCVTFTTSDGLAGDSVKAIFESSDGALWFGTWGSGLSRYQDEIWTTYTSDSGLIDNCVNVILESSDGAMWFGTEGGVSRYYLGNWTNFTYDDGLADNSVNSIIEPSDGVLWFGTDSGVSRYQQGMWTTFTMADGLADDYVQVIIKSSDGALWFGTSQGGVSRYQNGEWTTFNTDSGLANNDVKTMLESSDGAMWFGTWAVVGSGYENAVSRYQGGKWTTFTRDSGLVNSDVLSIIESSDGALWFGTFGGGASRFQPGIWTTFAQAGVRVRKIFESSDGALWFGNYDGVSLYQHGTWTTFTSDSGFAGGNVVSIIQSSDGALWFGTDEGASRYQDGIWTTLNTFTTDSGLVSNHITAIIESSDGALWFGTAWDGVSRYQNETWTTFTTDSGLVGDDIRAIIESSDGALWFGTEWNGVSHYQDGIWTNLTTIDGLVSDRIRAILESSDGALWFGTNMGVSSYHQEKWTTLTSADGLADNDVYAIIESSNGALWFGTCGQFGFGGGVSRFQAGTWTTFTTADGLADNNVMAIHESSDGALWFGTYMNGVSRLKPDKIPPFTIIDSGPKNNEKLGISAPMFTFHGFDYRTKLEHLSYTYVVHDMNGYLIEGDSLNERVLQLNLPGNGKYTFKIQAIDSWGNIDLTPATRTFNVDITPPTVTFNSPKPDDIVSNEVVIIGSVYDTSPVADLKYYKLSYGLGTNQEGIREWKTDRFSIIDSTREIRDSTLAIWNTEGLLNDEYLLKLSAWDSLEHESHDYINVRVVKASVSLDARQGGRLGTELGNIEIYIPPNAVSKDRHISVKDFSIQEIIPIDNPQITFANICFEIIPEDLQLLKPGTMSIIYPDSSIKGRNEEKLAIYHSPNGKENWQRLGGTVNVEENKITTTFKQLGVFALYEDLTDGGKSGILNVNSQPRIFSPQGNGYDDKTAISFDLGKESNVTIKIYNPPGRLVRVLKENEQMSRGNNVVYWDGKDQQGKFCVSGLYIVTVQAGEKMANKTVVVLNK